MKCHLCMFKIKLQNQYSTKNSMTRKTVSMP